MRPFLNLVFQKPAFSCKIFGTSNIKINMNGKFLLKLNILFGISLLLITGVNMMMLLENSFTKADIPPLPKRPSAAEVAEAKAVELPNLVSSNLKISSEAEDKGYHVGIPIHIACTIKNSSEFEAAHSRALIRSQFGDIASEERETIAPDESVTFEGTFTPEKSRITYIACRTDIDHEIEESDETDNRSAAALYVRAK